MTGATIYAGFIDAHDHFAMAAIGKLGVDLSGIVGKDAILAKVREYVAQNKDAKVLRGFGWYPGSFRGESPRREWLDEITGDVPMVVCSADIHDLWFNTAAMNAAGLTAATPDPEKNQYFVRDPDGTPTGHAVEGAAVTPVMAAVGTFSKEVFREAQRLTLDRAPSYGITGYFEAGVFMGATSADSEPVYADYVARDQEGRLDVRVFGSYWTRSESDDPAAVTAALVDFPTVEVRSQAEFKEQITSNVDQLLLQHPSNARLLLQIHDELVLECPQEHVSQLVPQLKQSMQDAMRLNVPLVVDVTTGSDWLNQLDA